MGSSARCRTATPICSTPADPWLVLVAGLLPDEVEQVDTVATLACPSLEEAAEACCSLCRHRSLGKRPSIYPPLGIADGLAESVVGPIRRRLA